MSKRMLIDATHEEETRVAIVDGNKLAEYDYESSSRKPIKGNIYLAKVTRVEPSLQAAFVNFGGNRHGFLPFSEIHPDYFRIPIADREALMAEQEALLAAQEAEMEAEAAAEAEAEAAYAGHTSGEDEAGEDQLSEEFADSEVSEIEEGYVEELGGAVASLEDIDAEDDGSVFNKAVPDSTENLYSVSDDVWTEGDASDETMPEAMELPEGDAALSEAAEGDAQGPQDGNRDRGRGRRGRRGRRQPFRSKRSEIVGEDEMSGEERFRFNLRRKYKIQEVIKRGQIMLVQANKEERGNKGAAVGTYLSLPGRYCVLMPNSPRAGGVSRKIANYKDRARMREIMKELEVPKGMSVIVRTAGVSRTKVEIKRDLDYLMRLWDNIRELTLQSSAPSMVYEEADLIKRAIRDLYTREVEDIVVAGENGFKTARNFMKMMVPSHIKKVNLYEENKIPLFTRYQIESQIQEIGMPSVRLRSGGYLVINPTEALVSIDVNSGKATKERHIEETALKTNLEAADEVARQLRLRDLGGLVVIDFIDMEDRRNNAKVERRLKEALSTDRARVQVGRISSFGLLELSRQRLSPSLTESQYEVCTHCKGVGVVRTPEAMSIVVLRAIEEEGIRGRSSQVTVHVSNAVALYILNNKRKSVVDLENRYSFEVVLLVDEDIPGSEYRLEISKPLGDAIDNQDSPVSAEDGSDETGEESNDNVRRNDRHGRGRRGGRNRHRDDRPERENRNDAIQADQNDSMSVEADADFSNEFVDEEGEEDPNFNTEQHHSQRASDGSLQRQDGNNNRRRRRGGRNRNRNRDRRDRGNREGGFDEKPKMEPNTSSHNSYEERNHSGRRENSSEIRSESGGEQAEKRQTFDQQPQPVVRAAQTKKEPHSSASYEVVSEPVKEKKRGWWNRLVE